MGFRHGHDLFHLERAYGRNVWRCIQPGWQATCDLECRSHRQSVDVAASWRTGWRATDLVGAQSGSLSRGVQPRWNEVSHREPRWNLTHLRLADPRFDSNRQESCDPCIDHRRMSKIPAPAAVSASVLNA